MEHRLPSPLPLVERGRSSRVRRFVSSERESVEWRWSVPIPGMAVRVRADGPCSLLAAFPAKEGLVSEQNTKYRGAIQNTGVLLSESTGVRCYYAGAGRPGGGGARACTC